MSYHRFYFPNLFVVFSGFFTNKIASYLYKGTYITFKVLLLFFMSR